MRKLIIAGMAVAMLAIIPAAASADVQRCEAAVTSTTTATFTAVDQPTTLDEWAKAMSGATTTRSRSPERLVHRHRRPERLQQLGPTMVDVPETITGTIDSGKISYTATRTTDNNVWHVTDATTGQHHRHGCHAERHVGHRQVPCVGSAVQPHDRPT